MKNNRIKDIRCPYCDKVLKNNFIRKHIINEHNLTDVEWMVLSEQQSDSDRRGFPNVPPEIVKQYLILVFKKLGKLRDIRFGVPNSIHSIAQYLIAGILTNLISTNFSMLFYLGNLNTQKLAIQGSCVSFAIQWTMRWQRKHIMI